MAYDFKREFRDLYQPKTAPALVDVPAMTFAAVAGAGDPNEEGGAYKRALELLYAFSYTVKMSKMGDLCFVNLSFHKTSSVRFTRQREDSSRTSVALAPILSSPTTPRA